MNKEEKYLQDLNKRFPDSDLRTSRRWEYNTRRSFDCIRNCIEENKIRKTWLYVLISIIFLTLIVSFFELISVQYLPCILLFISIVPYFILLCKLIREILTDKKLVKTERDRLISTLETPVEKTKRIRRGKIKNIFE